MKKLLWFVGLMALTGCPRSPIQAVAQNVEGQIVASQYGVFQLQGTATNSFVFSPASCQVTAGNTNFAALTQGVPVRVVDPGNHALDETVTAGLVNINACSVQLAVANVHIPPFYVTSGTAGLQESINANSKGGAANTIILDAPWYALGGSSDIITSVQGSTSLGLVDVTTTPYTWYAWNGSAYAKVSVGGGNPAGAAGAIQYNNANSFGGVSITGLVKGNGSSTPSAAVAGTDYQTPIVNACTGGISCPLTGSTYNFSYSGSAGSGTVGTGNQYQDATYPNSGSTTSVGALGNKYTLPTGLTTSQLNAIFSGLSTGTVTIQNGDSTTPFANPNFAGVQDLRETYPVGDWNVKESGAQCDLQGGYASLTQGSTTLTVTSGYSFSAADVGKYIEMVGYDTSTSLPSRFDATITAVTNSTTATLSTAAPFTVSEYSMKIGHRDDIAIASAFGHFTYRRLISFPTGNCWSDTIAVYGQSFHGNGVASQITGLAGDDTFASLDPTNPGFQGMGSDNEIYGMTWNFDARINAAQPWEDVAADGTVTPHAATYRPVGIFTVWANYPLGPGWIQGSGANNTGATNGVAATTQDSAVICIPTSETEPPVGQTIIFPYFSLIFTSTISSLSGSGCAAGTNPLTMAAAFPNTSDYTTDQSEWMSGTSVQTIQTAIPATGRTFPMTVDLSLDINPPLTPNVRGTASNVAPYGLIKIDGEECSYFSDSSYPATTSSTYWVKLTACAQNGTSAASHSIGATIVPLNPFQPTWPWPVTPSLNSAPMPVNASYFPAWDIGNAAWAQPTYNGVDWSPSAALSFSNMHDIQIQQDAFYAGNGGGTEGGPNAYQTSNATAGMYIVPLPYKATFKNIHIVDPQFGIFEGTPSINTHNMFVNGYPTADGSTWQNITIQSAGYDTLFIGGQSDTKRDFLTFCQNGGETGNSWPGQSLGVVGCGAAWIWGGTYDDQAGGGGSDNTHATLENWYVEPEDGAQAELQPMFEFNCTQCTYRINPFGGGVTFIEGGNNNFTGMQFNSESGLPVLNYGENTNMQWVESASQSYNGNTYGLGSFLNYGLNASIMGLTDNEQGTWGNLAAGNTIAPVSGQTGEAFETGNDAAAYISSSSAIIYPNQFADTVLDGPWVFDDTAPISHSYAICNTSPGMGCSSMQFNENGRIEIGPDQKIVPGKYVVHYAFKTPDGATNFNFQLAATADVLSCAGSTVLNTTITTTDTNWEQNNTTANPAPIVDFSGSSGCVLDMTIVNSPSPAVVQMAYLILTPVWTNITLPVNTPADNAACTPGAFLGSDTSYLYICTASGTVKRAALSTY